MLDRILKDLPKSNDPNLLVGTIRPDDAGVYRLQDNLALVQTLDFFTPIVDNPYDYGRISAANSLSDVYAMGGRPITAMNIVSYPHGDLPDEVLADILRGGFDACEEAKVAVCGGHSVTDKELKFGLSVTGLVDPGQMLIKGGAKPGDLLVLTKPLGSGLIANAMMNDADVDEAVKAATAIMVRLNRAAAEAAVKVGARAATDVTGFGLLGHAREMAEAADVTFHFQASKLPVIEGAMWVAESGSYYSGGERRNRDFVDPTLSMAEDIPESYQRIMADPQTSGGLLLAINPESFEVFQDEINKKGEECWLIGTVESRSPVRVRVSNV